MLSRQTRILGASLSSLVLAGCAVDNPWFGLASEDPATSDTGTTEDPGATSGTNTTGNPVTTGTTSTTSATGSLATSDTDEPTTDASTTRTVATTTGHVIDSSGTDTGADTTTGTGDDTTTTDTSTSDPSMTTESEPVVEVIPADIATCVLRKKMFPSQPYAGPAECETIAAKQSEAEAGVMALDVALVDGGGKSRRAEIYLRFSVPNFPEGKNLVTALVTIHVDTDKDAGGLFPGPLFAVNPFTLEGLSTDAPPMGNLLTTASGTASPGEIVTWSIDPVALAGGTATHLAVMPADPDGIIFRSAGAEPNLVPTLTLTFE